MSGDPSRITVVFVSTIQSTHTTPAYVEISELPTQDDDRAGFTRVAVGGAIGGFFMTVFLAAGVVWLWKRKHPDTTPWDRRSENDVETAVQSVEQNKVTEEEKLSRSPPASEGVCSPRDYEYGSYGNPAALAVNTAARPGSVGSMNSIGGVSPVASPSTSSPALPLSRHSSSRAGQDRIYSTSENHGSYPSSPPSFPAPPPSAWHGPPVYTGALPHNIPLPPSPQTSRRYSLPTQNQHYSPTHYRSASTSYYATELQSASSHSSHSGRRIIIPKVLFMEPETGLSADEERGRVRLSVTNPDREEPTPPPSPGLPSPTSP